MDELKTPAMVHLVIATLVASALGAAIAAGFATWGLRTYERRASLVANVPMSPSISPLCNVVALSVHGSIVGSRSEIPVADMLSIGDGSGSYLTPNYAIANDIEYYLTSFAADPNVKALLLDVDSGGGDSQAGEEIARAVRAFGKPSVAVIHGMGASSGYLAASAADRVFAFESSTIGSIGATYSFINQYEKNQKDGITYVQLSSGPFKDILSPDKQMTDEERSLVERDLTTLKDAFVRSVAEYRHQPIEKIEALADGSSMLGRLALESGLIDEIGGRPEAVRYLEQQLTEPASLCWQ